MSFQQGVTTPATLPVTAYNFFQFSLELCGPGTISSISFDTGHNATDAKNFDGIIQYQAAGGAPIGIGFDTFAIPFGFNLQTRTVTPNLTLGDQEEVFFRIRFNTQTTDGNRFTAQFRLDNVVVEGECTTLVDIDIKPGSFPNSINIGSSGATPVAILGSATLDVNDIDTTTLTLGTAGLKSVGNVKTVGKNDRQLCSIEDVSGDFSLDLEGMPDGFDDLVCHFVIISLIPEIGDTTATLSGNFTAAAGGGAIEGTDSVNIVQ